VPEIEKEPQKTVEKRFLTDFKEFLLVNRRLEPTTVKETMQDTKRFLKMSKYVVCYESVKAYLGSYLSKSAKTYTVR